MVLISVRAVSVVFLQNVSVFLITYPTATLNSRIFPCHIQTKSLGFDENVTVEWRRFLTQVFVACFKALFQTLRATTRNVRHNVKVFCDSNGLSHRCQGTACPVYLFVACLQSVPDPGVEVSSYRNVTGRHDECWTETYARRYGVWDLS